LYAVFTPVTYGVTTVIAPAHCGSVFLNAQPTYNGTTVQLAPGVYPIVIHPCQGDEVAQIILDGGVAVVGAPGSQVVYVNGSGTITILFGAVPPELTLSVPSTAAAGLGVFFGASIAVLVEPFNYTYNWSFGDGSNTTTNVNSTEHVYNSPGTYLVRVTVTDPLGRTVSATASIAVSSLSSTVQVNDAIPALIAVGLAVLVIAAAWVYSGRRGPPAKDASEDPDYTLPGAAEEPDALPGPVEPSSLTETPSSETPPGSPGTP
ncbi:MAG TPA: PKD domain-containing protein, partial [Thermoplasmata archaeon]|nr:PKD domain-containing protein [Thermoplasmata archaeon]